MDINPNNFNIDKVFKHIDKKIEKYEKKMKKKESKKKETSDAFETFFDDNYVDATEIIGSGNQEDVIKVIPGTTIPAPMGFTISI